MHLASYLSLALLAKLSAAGYVLKDDYGTSDKFFDNFNFYTSKDPTNGFVDYVSQDTAKKGGLISGTDNSTYMGVDHTNVVSGDGGRQSVRVTSKNSYTNGLVILNLSHMPGGICGTWPAFWMVGGDWPNDGEIDIIEGVNDQSKNAMALHTSDGCSIQNSGFTGSLSTSNCYTQAAGQSTNAGCSISSTDTDSYGSGFNDGGGVYATEWTSDAISIWFFAHDKIPSDIIKGVPTPSSWGNPTARYAGSCDIDSHFKKMNIVFDTTFCGDWAGSVWSTSSTCASKASTCNDYVANNPSAFKDAYWGINSLKVYQDTSLLSALLPRRSGAARRHAVRHGAHGRNL